jgi:uncharacterized protein
MLRLTLIASFALLAACGPSRVERAQPMMNNPAGVNCTTRGGQLVIRQSGGGQKGFCLLSDGRSVGIWEYYRQTNG